MSEHLIDHPVTPFVTSIGGIGLQVLCWPFLFLVGVSADHDSIILRVAEVAWFSLPLFSVLGIVSAVARLRKRVGMALAAVGLLLNVLYLLLFMLIVLLVFVIGVTA